MTEADRSGVSAKQASSGLTSDAERRVHTMIRATRTAQDHDAARREGTVSRQPDDDPELDPEEGRAGRGGTIAVGLVTLLLLALTAASASQSASPVTLPSRDTEDLVITLKELPDFPTKTSYRWIRNDRRSARAHVSYTADEGAPGAAAYPTLIDQTIEYTSDAGSARSELESERRNNADVVKRVFSGSPPRVDLPIRSGRREARVTQTSDGSTVMYEIDYHLNNIMIDTVLVGSQSTLTEERALELAQISLKKYDNEVRGRTTFLPDPYEDWDLEALVDPLSRVSVPLIGFVLVILFFPSAEQQRQLEINPHLLSGPLAGLYAWLLWRSITISGTGTSVLFDFEGWGGMLTVFLTVVVAAMGVRHLWWHPYTAPALPAAVGGVPTGQASCPRCRRLSPAASPRCQYCGLEFRGRA
jgi:hypothetical protein